MSCQGYFVVDPDSTSKKLYANIGKKSGRGALFLETHTNPDGSYVNDEAKEICPNNVGSGQNVSSATLPVGARRSSANSAPGYQVNA
ncbi:hypothetical protein M9H77_09147 [Catharanthus roseus]|uniref:Uncharacterized protein n=1 Tax=Catharanthus roseus TaxID=4058 RepID=A0ACC0BZZ2_CATRO|nr:hypothetical protein M9H77_09147 [Catharanthus roseus]